MDALSPLVRRGLQENADLANTPGSGLKELDDYWADEEISYRCCKCRRSHDEEHDAMRCCMPAWLQRLADLEDTGATCPVCKTPARDEYDATDCCLWKDLGIAARHRIAREVEGGATWADAIAKEAS